MADIAKVLKDWAWIGEKDPDTIHLFAKWRDLKEAVFALYPVLVQAHERIARQDKLIKKLLSRDERTGRRPEEDAA